MLVAEFYTDNEIDTILHEIAEAPKRVVGRVWMDIPNEDGWFLRRTDLAVTNGVIRYVPVSPSFTNAATGHTVTIADLRCPWLPQSEAFWNDEARARRMLENFDMMILAASL